VVQLVEFRYRERRNRSQAKPSRCMNRNADVLETAKLLADRLHLIGPCKIRTKVEAPKTMKQTRHRLFVATDEHKLVTSLAERGGNRAADRSARTCDYRALPRAADVVHVVSSPA